MAGRRQEVEDSAEGESSVEGENFGSPKDKKKKNPRTKRRLEPGEDGSIIVGKILEKDQYAYGFDAQNGEYVNLVTKGIIDPTKVVRAALQNGKTTTRRPESKSCARRRCHAPMNSPA